MPTTRRTFLQTASLAAAAAGLGPLACAGENEAATPAPSPSGKESLRMLILGGTGFLGPAVVKEAIARGHSMTLFNRGKSKPHLFPDLEKLKGDRHDDLEALEGRAWDVVIDTSAYVPSHVTATAGMFADSAKHYVLLSSTGVYADHSRPADESSEVAQITDEEAAKLTTIRESLQQYAAMKARCEKAAEAAMPGRVTNIRPGLIVGPEDWSDRFTYWVIRTRDGGEVLAPGDGKDWVQLVDARDLANFILDCVEKKIFGLFNAISPPWRWTFDQMLYGIKASFATDARYTWVDGDFLGEHEVAAWTNLPVWVPREGELGAFHLVHSRKAMAAGLKFRPLAETAQDTAAWFDRDMPDDYDFGKRAGISREKQAEVLKAWHARTPVKEEPKDE